MTKQPRCPKCRAEGADTDCLDQLADRYKVKHDVYLTEDQYTLEVTFRFDLPVDADLAPGPHDAATRLWELLAGDEGELRRALELATSTEFDLNVRPVFG